MSPFIFISPVIALILVVVLYVYFSKKVTDKHNYRDFVVVITVVAFVLNLIWELEQGPLYKNFEYDDTHIIFCALASVADMLMVLILFFGFGLVYNNVFWIKRLTVNKVLSLVAIGTVGAIIAEIWHTSQGDWAYAEAMPMLPIVEVGLVPMFQFALLPILIFVVCLNIVKM